MYIECNFHWTHGGHKFDPDNKDDINTLNKWKEKYESSNHQMLGGGIKTCTERDPKKFEYAKKNNLNYLVFYNETEFKDYFNQK